MSDKKDQNETVACQFCGRVLRRGLWLGSMQRVLDSHQKGRDCLTVQSAILKLIVKDSETRNKR